MNVCVLASDSSGNCVYVEDKDTKLLFDVGISAKQVAMRLNNIGISPTDVDGIFVTHEHSDHIRGIDVLSRKFDIPIYANKETAKAIAHKIQKPIEYFTNGEEMQIKDLKINSYSKSHDAVDPVFFEINGRKKFSIITDAGYACENIKKAVMRSDSMVLESNHDIEMLLNGMYPYHLKQRIFGDTGHLSNVSAAELIRDYGQKLDNVFLAHLSKNNNKPEIAYHTFKHLVKDKMNVHITSKEQGELIKL